MSVCLFQPLTENLMDIVSATVNRVAEQTDASQARIAQNQELGRRRRQAERQSEPQQTSVPALEDG